MMEEEWKPRTDLGQKVKSKEITDINQILDAGAIIQEPQITDTLLPETEQELLMIGQSKGKFGGGRRRIFRQTQKKTREGNKPKFAAYAVIGNKDGILGMGYGKAQETVPAREKATRNAKLNLFKIARGSGSWESTVKEPHTIPFSVEGRCGSVIVKLMPAPKGKGLVADKEIQKILGLAGIKDVWSKTLGQTKNKINVIKATEQALRKLATTKLREQDHTNLSVVYGNAKAIKIQSDKEFAEETAKVAEPAPVAPKEPVASDLDSIPGVGAAKVKKLQEAGINTKAELLAMNAKDLSAKIGGSEAYAQKLLDAAGGYE